MTLQWQNVQFPFGHGIDTKTDPKLVQPPNLTTLENGVFNNGGSIIKRNGYAALPQQVVSPALGAGSTIQTGVGIVGYKNELLAFDGNVAYSYAPAQNVWRSRGSITSCIPTTIPVANTTLRYSAPSSAVAGATRVTAYLDDNSAVRITVADTVTGTVHLVDAVIATGTNLRPKVVAGNSGQSVFVIYANSATQLSLVSISAQNPQLFTAPLVIVNDMVAATFDVSMVNNVVVLAYAYDNGTSNSGVMLARITDTGSIGFPAGGYPAPIKVSTGTTGNAPPYIKVIAGTGNIGNQFYIAMYATSLKLLVYGQSGSIMPMTGAYVFPNTTGFTLRNLAGVQLPDPQDAGRVQVFYETFDGNTFLATAGPGGVPIQAGQNVAYGLYMVSDAFAYQGVAYISLAYASSLQPTYFVYSDAGDLVGKHSAQIAGFTPTAGNSGTVPAVTQISPGNFEFAKIERGNLTTSATGSVSFPNPVVTGQFNFLKSTRYSTCELNFNLYIAAGIVYLYDGATLVEDGFALSPEGLSYTTATTGGAMVNGTYLYKACWSWSDARGQRLRSATSLPIAVTLTGNTTTQSVAVRIPTLRVTRKQNVTLELYRTLSNGTVYHRVASSPAMVYSPDLIITDTQADVGIAPQPILYTDGGELDNDAPPPMRYIFSSKNRIFGIPSEAPNTLWYTKEVVKGVGVGWSAGLQRNIPPLGGDSEVVGAIDDSIVVFKASKIYAFQGQGPTNAGTQDTFTPLQLINTDVGCIDGASLIFTSEGLMFQSKKGIRLLSRTLQMVDVGAPVQAFNNAVITSAQLLPDVNQVRFTTNTGKTLVYDYYWRFPDPSAMMTIGQWSTFTNQPAVDATIWRGQYVYLTALGKALVETPGLYLDDNNFYSLTVETANFAATGPQGLFRCRRAYLLGTYSSPHNLTVNIAYNYGDFSQTQVWDTSRGIDLTTWGQGNSWGSDKVWGGVSDGVYQFRINPARQRVQAIRFRFQDAPLGKNPVGAAYSLTSFAMEVGGKKGLFKLGTQKQAR